MRLVALATVVLACMAASATSARVPARSGLRGTVRIDPGYPVCRVGSSCTRPAAHVWLAFSRRGKVVARVRTSDTGSYQIRLAPGTYDVSSPPSRRQLTPHRVVVRRGYVRRVDFSLDIGIR
jgi:hypothetical protein